MVEDQLDRALDAAYAIRQGDPRSLRNGLHGLTPSLAGCVVTTVGPGVGFPVVLCYDCHDSNPHMRGWVEGQVLSLAVAHLAFSLAKNLVKYYHSMRKKYSKILPRGYYVRR